MIVNLTTSLSMQSCQWIQSYLLAEDADLIKKEVFSRIAYFTLADLQLLSGITDIALGVITGVGSLLLLRSNKTVNRWASNYLMASNMLLSEPYYSIIHIIRPSSAEEKSFGIKSKKDSEKLNGKMGFVSNFLISFFHALGESCDARPGFVKKHLISRLSYALSAVASLVTRAADGVIAVIAVPLSLVTLGRIQAINLIAYRSLQFTGIIHDLFYDGMKMINPAAQLNATLLDCIQEYQKAHSKNKK